MCLAATTYDDSQKKNANFNGKHIWHKHFKIFLGISCEFNISQVNFRLCAA